MRRSLKHAFREQETPNADMSQTSENSHFGATNSQEALEQFNARLATQEKVRSNAVLAIEYLITASPEAMRDKSREQQDGYFHDALDWLRNKHGGENVIYAGIHRDETTPHMYAYVVPIDARGKLNCRSFLGGAKALNQMQTDFAQDVGQPHGLERGLERSRARHVPIREYYARICRAEQKEPAVNVPEPSIRDRLNPAAYGQRVANSVVEQLGPRWKELSAKEQELGAARQEKREARSALQEQSQRLRPIVDVLRTLTPAERKVFVDIARAAGERIRGNRTQERTREPQRTKPSRDKGISR